MNGANFRAKYELQFLVLEDFGGLKLLQAKNIYLVTVANECYLWLGGKVPQDIVASSLDIIKSFY